MAPLAEANLSDLRHLNGYSAAALALCVGLTAGPALAAEAGACLEGAAKAEASGVVDARSLQLADGRVLRVAGIEPFDLLIADQHDAEAALQQRLKQLVGGGPLMVQLASKAADRYGRYPALVAAGGALVQESLAREGLAIAFASGDPLACFDRILAAEDAARRAGHGFWAGVSLAQARPEALGPQVGHFAIFEGKIISVGNRGARTYLNFGLRWSKDVTVEIEARDRKRFKGKEGLAALAGHRVRVRGFVEAKAGPMVVIRSPMQLEVLEADASGKESAP